MLLNSAHFPSLSALLGTSLKSAGFALGQPILTTEFAEVKKRRHKVLPSNPQPVGDLRPFLKTND